jgi:hypothetical protein
MNALIKQNRRILMALDVAEFRLAVPEAADAPDDVIILAMHRARVQFLALPQSVRDESAEWLRVRNA